MRFAEAFDRGPTLINPIVYAEVSIWFDRIEELEQALPGELERGGGAAVGGGVSRRQVLPRVPAAWR